MSSAKASGLRSAEADRVECNKIRHRAIPNFPWARIYATRWMRDAATAQAASTVT
jgi:hypothetical protein